MKPPPIPLIPPIPTAQPQDFLPPPQVLSGSTEALGLTLLILLCMVCFVALALVVVAGERDRSRS
jgi:hypothetical protein